MVPRRTRCSLIGLCLGFFGLFFGIYWEKILYSFIEKALVISTESPIYNIWRKPPMNVSIDFYLFNWTNPQDFRNPNIKPKFEEIGPYSFIQSEEKVDIVWHHENASVSYRKRPRFYFDAQHSGRNKLSDVITTINTVAVGASHVSQYFSTTRRAIAEFGMMVYPRDLTVRKTADELLFKGYSDTLLSIINAFPVTNFDMPDKYGYCYGRNNSANFLGTFNVHTGAHNINEVGQMYAWNYNNNSECYASECSKIRGSAGEFMGPHLRPGHSIRIFAREFCRDMPLEFDSITSVNGVRGFRYIAGLQAIDNGTLNAENACLCNGECLPAGVMNVSKCWFNSPLFVSYPHFYKADPYYLSQLEGLRPQQGRHEFSYIVEPKTSISLDVIARSQMNVLVQPIAKSRMFHDVRKIMFPLFWAEARTSLLPELLFYLEIVSYVILCGRILAGILCLLGFSIAIYYAVIYQLKYKLVLPLEHQDFRVVSDVNDNKLERNTLLTDKHEKDFIRNR